MILLSIVPSIEEMHPRYSKNKLIMISLQSGAAVLYGKNAYS